MGAQRGGISSYTVILYILGGEGSVYKPFRVMYNAIRSLYRRYHERTTLGQKFCYDVLTMSGKVIYVSQRFPNEYK